jgi:hypothetical protein
MIFIYNSNEPIDKKLSEKCEQNAKIGNNPKYQFTATCPVNGAAKQAGRELLQKGFGTIPYITGYLDNLAAGAKGNTWVQQDLLKTQYVWVVGPRTADVVLANPPGQKTFKFVDYSKFFPLP